jgi:uncharacterized membrane protein
MTHAPHAPDIRDPSVYFDAALHPHRSLDRTGFILVMTLAAAFGFTIGVGFLLAGAWPVFGFCFAEVLLLYIAFRINFRNGQCFEHLVLSDEGLLVRRYGPKGEVGRWEFEPSWLQINVDEKRPRGGALTLSSHGRSLTIGGFLTHGERTEVADALRTAIAQYQRPTDIP